MTKAQYQHYLKMRDENKPMEDIFKALGMTKSTFYRHLKAFESSPKPQSSNITEHVNKYFRVLKAPLQEQPEPPSEEITNILKQLQTIHFEVLAALSNAEHLSKRGQAYLTAFNDN